ncbi:DUF1659 domain-containing protein [Hathewaya histolytica]|uniref:DUF1659 domain-containing protein n=1 Tax=Hathewaya histolytica TaxID=1498 RepID=UPI003B67D3F1
MSVISQKSQRVFNVQYAKGVNAKGEDIIKEQKIGSIKLEAKDEDVFAIGEAIKNIMATTISGFIINEEVELIKQN